MRNLLIFPELVKKFIRSFHHFNRILSHQAVCQRSATGSFKPHVLLIFPARFKSTTLLLLGVCVYRKWLREKMGHIGKEKEKRKRRERRKFLKSYPGNQLSIEGIAKFPTDSKGLYLPLLSDSLLPLLEAYFLKISRN